MRGGRGHGLCRVGGRGTQRARHRERSLPGADGSQPAASAAFTPHPAGTGPPTDASAAWSGQLVVVWIRMRPVPRPRAVRLAEGGQILRTGGGRPRRPRAGDLRAGLHTAGVSLTCLTCVLGSIRSFSPRAGSTHVLFRNWIWAVTCCRQRPLAWLPQDHLGHVGPGDVLPPSRVTSCPCAPLCSPRKREREVFIKLERGSVRGAGLLPRCGHGGSCCALNARERLGGWAPRRARGVRAPHAGVLDTTRSGRARRRVRNKTRQENETGL